MKKTFYLSQTSFANCSAFEWKRLAVWIDWLHIKINHQFETKVYFKKKKCEKDLKIKSRKKILLIWKQRIEIFFDIFSKFEYSSILPREGKRFLFMFVFQPFSRDDWPAVFWRQFLPAGWLPRPPRGKDSWTCLGRCPPSTRRTSDWSWTCRGGSRRERERLRSRCCNRSGCCTDSRSRRRRCRGVWLGSARGSLAVWSWSRGVRGASCSPSCCSRRYGLPCRTRTDRRWSVSRQGWSRFAPWKL